MRADSLAGRRRHVRVSYWFDTPRRSLSAATLAGVLLFTICLYARPGAVMAGTPKLLPTLLGSNVADVVSHDLRFSRDHGFLVLSGEARNVSRRDLPQLEAVVEFFDEDGRLVTAECGLVKMGSIATGDEAPFEVQAKDDPAVSSYRIRFHRLAGAPVPSRIEG
jgi:hypothetical protein